MSDSLQRLKARNAALRRLIKLHPKEFEQLYTHELKKRTRAKLKVKP